MSPAELYHYKAYVVRVPSATTCLVDIDLGLGVWTRGQEVQLHRFSGPADKDAIEAARDFLRSLVLDREVLLRTVKHRRDNRSRLFGELIVVTEVGDTVNVIDTMIEQGHGTRGDN